MISIIVLNWNTTDMLIRLYESLKINTTMSFETIIVDNGSVKEQFDKLTAYVNSQNRDIVLERLESNIGFAAGNNVGLKLINSFNAYVVFINSDIVVEEKDWDSKLLIYLNAGAAGVVGCAYHPLKWDKNGKFHIQPIPQGPVESESVQGAFFATKTKILKQLYTNDGCYFDEAYKYAHFEESDLCLRVINLGYKCLWVPISHIHDHNHSATKANGYHLNDEIKNIDDFKANSERNRQLLFKKHSAFFESRT